MKVLLLAVAVAIAVMFALTSSTAQPCSGCGCRGGPGYRGPNGQCVGWANLNKVCGVPPTKNCTNEGGKDESAAPKKGDSGKEAPRKPFWILGGTGGLQAAP